jgi:hypothetical protein
VTGTAPENHRDNPYFGLSPFGQKDNEWFFGRDADTDRVVTNLLASRLTLLHAETGVGKSSLLRAGVARRLEAAALTASRRRACVYLPVVFQSWRDDPVGELIGDIASAVAKVANDGGVPVREAEHLDRAIEAGVGDSNTVLLVILDQFEEYFHYAPFEQGGSGRFAEELARCVNRPEVPASFLISIRQDAYASLGNLLEGRIANVYGNYLRIDPLDREAAESAIRGPLDVFNEQEGMPRMTIEKELVAAILDQAQLPNGLAAAPEGTPCENGSIATPVLQLAMDAVWRHERDAGSTTLRLATLEELSRDGQSVVGGFLRHKMAVLDDRKYGVAIDALDHMVTPDGGKIAVSAAQLAPRIRHSERLINGVSCAASRRPPARGHQLQTGTRSSTMSLQRRSTGRSPLRPSGARRNSGASTPRRTRGCGGSAERRKPIAPSPARHRYYSWLRSRSPSSRSASAIRQSTTSTPSGLSSSPPPPRRSPRTPDAARSSRSKR